MNELDKINQFPSTFDQIARFVSQVKDEALSGDHNVLEVLIQLRACEKALEILNKDDELQEAAQKMYDSYGEKNLVLNGNKITTMEAGTKYAYEETGDPKWAEYDDGVKYYTGLRKEREEFLKTVKESFTVIDEKTGDMAKINPAPKTSVTKLKITLK
jgi:hypothetical protein